MLMVFPSVLTAQVYLEPDTLDEDDFIHSRDTVKMSRKNIALDNDDRNYGIDYVIDDRYLVSNEQFSRGTFENIYFSGGTGFDFLQARTEGYDPLQVTQFHLAVGKQFTPVHSLRFSLGAGMTYLSDESLLFVRGSAKLDYLYDLSAHFSGYKATRPLSVSLLAGVGANVVRHDYSWNMRFVPDVHGGLQFRIYTGPRCYLNIEPYASLSADQRDHNSDMNWRHYDVSYGLNLNLQYYLFDQLSAQSKLRLLQQRGEGSIMVDRETIDTWRTPWFFEYGVGPVFSRPQGEGIAVGNSTSVSVGRWLSPVMGFRIGAAMTSALSDKVPAASSVSGVEEMYHSQFKSGRVEFLVNPFGFSRNFSWDAQYGAYLTLGTELGKASFYDMGNMDSYMGQAFTTGIHLWTKLTDDLQFFIEPRFSHTIFTHHLAEEGFEGKKVFYNNTPGLNLGLTMLIRSEKFHELDEFDRVQNFMHSYVRGFRVGLLGGFSAFQPSEVNYGGIHGYNASGYLEYRFSHLHSVRGMLELMQTKRNDFDPLNSQLLSVSQNSVIGSIDYQVSLTNLLSGILMKRWCELEAYIGPSAQYVFTTSGYPDDEFVDRGPMFGGNVGLKLSKHIWNGLSLVVSPTIYLMRGTKPASVNTTAISRLYYYQTFGIGVQYKIGSVHRNPAKVRQAKVAADVRWAEKQQRKMDKQQRRIDRKILKLIDN